MGEIRGQFYEMVMTYLPDVNPANPASRECILRAMRWLSSLAPLIGLLDEQTHAVEGVANPATIADFLVQLLRLDDEGTLTLTLVPADDAEILPETARGYQQFFNRLVIDELDAFDDKAFESLGPEAWTRLRDDLWKSLYSPLTTHLLREYEGFFQNIELNVGVNVIHGCFTLISAFVTAVVIDDYKTVAWLTPIIRQLPMSLPVGTIGADPLHWYVLTPGKRPE